MRTDTDELSTGSYRRLLTRSPHWQVTRRYRESRRSPARSDCPALGQSRAARRPRWPTTICRSHPLGTNGLNPGYSRGPSFGETVETDRINKINWGKYSKYYYLCFSRRSSSNYKNAISEVCNGFTGFIIYPVCAEVLIFIFYSFSAYIWLFGYFEPGDTISSRRLYGQLYKNRLQSFLSSRVSSSPRSSIRAEFRSPRTAASQPPSRSVTRRRS